MKINGVRRYKEPFKNKKVEGARCNRQIDKRCSKGFRLHSHVGFREAMRPDLRLDNSILHEHAFLSALNRHCADGPWYKHGNCMGVDTEAAVPFQRSAGTSTARTLTQGSASQMQLYTAKHKAKDTKDIIMISQASIHQMSARAKRSTVPKLRAGGFLCVHLSVGALYPAPVAAPACAQPTTVVATPPRGKGKSPFRYSPYSTFTSFHRRICLDCPPVLEYNNFMSSPFHFSSNNLNSFALFSHIAELPFPH